MARRLLVFAVAAVVVAVTAQLGLWFVPFIAGVAAGLLSLRWRHVVISAAAGATAGWGLPLWILALRGFPSGATARAIAGFAGLPPHAAVLVVVTLLLAFLQAVAGAWLARAFAPRPRYGTQAAARRREIRGRSWGGSSRMPLRMVTAALTMTSMCPSLPPLSAGTYQ